MSSVDLEKSDVVILGDLNADMMASSKLPKRDKQELLNFSRAYNFTQLIKEPTRITDASRTMIDLVFANNEHRIVKSGVVPVPLSDHFLVFCIIKAGITTKAKPRILEYPSYKNFNPTLFNDCNLQGQNTRTKNPSKPLNTVRDIKRTRREVKEVT